MRPPADTLACVFRLLAAGALCVWAGAARADGLAVPDASGFIAYDRPSDDGSAIAVLWPLSVSDGPGVYYILEIASLEDYREGVFRPATPKPIPSLGSRASDDPQYCSGLRRPETLHYVAVFPADIYPPSRRPIPPPNEQDPEDLARYTREAGREEVRLKEERRCINAQTYYFRLAITDGAHTVYVGEPGAPTVVSAAAKPNLFKGYRTNNLVFSLLFCAVVLGFIRLARRRPHLFIRRIPALDAVEEAIGRATEMGRPVFFVHGMDGLGSLSTIAALTILNRVVRRAAEYDVRVRVTNVDALVTAVSQEVAKQAYTEAGRPDAYNPDDISLVASDQFSYVAATSGLMVREQPGSIFLVGYFYAESLLLAETGAATGAIQIAGTDSYSQVPFLVTACDYTLIGEELYAASAYLSREPLMLGSLRGQDVGKVFLMAVFVLGTILGTFGIDWVSTLFRAF